MLKVSVEAGRLLHTLDIFQWSSWLFSGSWHPKTVSATPRDKDLAFWIFLTGNVTLQL